MKTTPSLPFNSGEKRDRLPSGRYVPGHSLAGPGRPRRIDFRKVVEERAAADGVDVEGELWAVYRAQLELARTGDTMAARFVFAALVDPDPVAVQFVDDRITDDDAARQIASLLAVAAARASCAHPTVPGRLPSIAPEGVGGAGFTSA